MADIPESAMRLPSAAKARILAAATELFYSEGIRATGVDRIIAEAKVTKSTFYKYYPAKDLLILDYLAYSSLRERTLLISLVAETDDPVRQLMRVTE
ncbi:MAG: TetR/AcrR family transcriptional regulator, partial [Microbacteriaceae bacterium]